jgi:hypothetical protein
MLFSLNILYFVAGLEPVAGRSGRFILVIGELVPVDFL